LNLLIENIDKEDLIDSLERPLDTDPLKKLAYIFSHEPEEPAGAHNETMNPSTLLSLDFFSKMERAFKSRYP